METIIQNGDYVYDGAGGFIRATGHEALLRRCLARLQARRGGFVLMPDFGSQLHNLSSVRPSERAAAARAAAAEALANEPVSVRAAEISTRDGDYATLDLTIDYDDGGSGQLSLATQL